MILDARTKIILVVATSITYGMRLTGIENVVLVLGLSLLFWFSGKRQIGVIGFVVYASLLALSSLPILPAWLLHLLLVLGYIWPPLLAGHFLLLTTTSYELIHGLRKWYLPESFLLALGVMFRFLSTVKQDARLVQVSLRVRGIFLRKRDILYRPCYYVECFFVPLMMSLLRTVQELTVASLTKGLVLHRKPSEFAKSSWTWLDWSLCLCCLIFLVLVQLL